ncbi:MULTISPECIES: N-acetylmuramoyl-L-alanine amidase [Anoxybacillus]|uniref:N-acetylmuramoyl-L-alanine amidase n=1 Tax=Anoxybacillus flavithermus TaxID=33934 RepID=A0A178TSJ8_9BACL|nr:N-acetylmuramoyl-L-alanine amidase [Anoxybacillus flavithermus]ASA95852.1 N-acetylmuramoyl-L-alanine amidase [Anoxybacillus flavithermus]ELK22080.1 sporulation-specific N-acetylmuramoyl-L-alanine amidase [Anoxybacillus flavithermus TNO-09.006]MBE2908445.1 N-acetylmuramoyl-L-alanine amidase [Anoxybacillus flavithermus]MBE2910690.1 N-acetylmuramoyl-L-alanine amidase [Anoxybacillus flavithermus]MBE2914401.1 N-acetylmuramoyl-L-alanine amidase [Anoxybacillus flavithermus]
MVRIVLDAGHGGKDVGAVGNGLREKDLTLTIVKHIGRMLGEYEGVEVHYTRTDDRFLELSERAELANKLKADYFISVHINAGGGTGFESYVHPNANSATIAYQNVIHAEIMKAIGNVTDRGKKRANYAVLRETHMPVILTENLFIDNANDTAKLKSEQFLLQVAHGHVEGIVKVFGLKKKAKTQPQQKVPDGKLYRVQVGAFSDIENAERLAEELKKKGYPSIIV